MKKTTIFMFVMLCLYNIGNTQNLGKNLLLHYKFDGNAQDVSKNKFHGTPVNVVAIDDRNGNPKSAYHFDGTAYVDMPFDKKLQPDFPISVAFWFKLDNYDSALISFFDNDFSINNYYGIFCSIVTTGKRLGMGFGDGGRIGRDSRRGKRGTTTIEINTWYHVVLVYKEALDMVMYINGCPDGGTYSGAGERKVNYMGNHGTIGRIDANATPGPIYHLEGSMDEFYMWDRALTQADVTELYFGERNTVLDLGGDKILCEGRDYPITITKQFDSVLWSTGDKTNTIIVKKPGTYSVQAFRRDCHYFRDTIVFKGSKCLKGGCGCSSQ